MYIIFDLPDFWIEDNCKMICDSTSDYNFNDLIIII